MKIDWDFVGGLLCCVLIIVLFWAVMWVVYP
jgi:hypothetical protein